MRGEGGTWVWGGGMLLFGAPSQLWCAHVPTWVFFLLWSSNHPVMHVTIWAHWDNDPNSFTHETIYDGSCNVFGFKLQQAASSVKKAA